MALLINEKFEGNGTPAGWFRGGSADFDYATNPIKGCQSLRMTSAGGDYAVILTGINNKRELWGKLRWRVSAIPAAFTKLFTLIDVSFNTLMELTLLSNGTVQASDSGVGIFTASIGTMSANVPYYIWWHWKVGTGANGVVDVMFNTVNVRPFVGSSKWVGGSTGTQTAYVDQLTFQVPNGVDHDVDEMQIADTDEFSGLAKPPSWRKYFVPNMPLTAAPIRYRPQKTNIKPPVGAQIDRLHPLARGLRACYLFNNVNSAELLSRRLTSISGGSPSLGQGPLGTGVKFTGSGDQLQLVSNIQLLGSQFTTDVSIVMIRQKLDGTLPFASHFGTTDNDPSRLHASAPYQDGNVYWDFGETGSGRVTWTGYTPTIAVEHWVFTTSLNFQGIYFNGELKASQASGVTRSATTSGLYLNQGVITQGDLQMVYAFYAYSRALTANEVKQLYREPYAFLLRPTHRASVPLRTGFATRVRTYR